MKNLIILCSMLLIGIFISSCETQQINDETAAELQMVDPADDGTIDPGDEEEY